MTNDDAAKVRLIEEAFRFKRVSTLTVDAWADQYRVLPLSAAIPGPWRTSRAEIARGPMRAVTVPGTRTITCMVATQTLKTELLLNVVGFHVHQAPCSMLLTQPKESAARSFAKERVIPMFDSSPVLRELFDAEGSRREDTIAYHAFPGGFLAVEGAGSPANLASRAIRITMLDEIDKYENLKAEGDPLLLAEERTATFTDSLRLRVCSPTWTETSRIFKSYQESDQRRAYVKCPHDNCRHEQALDFFKHVHWNKTEEGEHLPHTAAIYCEECGAEWLEEERTTIMTTQGAIRWMQTRPFECCSIRQEPMRTRNWEWSESDQVGYACCTECGKRSVSAHHAGFQASKLYSPLASASVRELAEKWILAKNSHESKLVFTNTQLGLPFEVQAMRKIEPHALTARREKYAAEVPMGVHTLTAGVDVQVGGAANEGRLEVEVVGWGLEYESWSVAHEVFVGDPSQPDVWNRLDVFLLRGFQHEKGWSTSIVAACVDTGGHNTQAAYRFCRVRRARNVWAIKGASDRGGQWVPVWPPRVPSKKYREGFRPVVIGVNSAKEIIRQHLMLEEPGPGFCHFPVDRSSAFFEQLTSEDLQIENRGGAAHKVWRKKGGRANEALDCRVYAYAALCGFESLGHRLERRAIMVETAPVAPSPVAPPDVSLPPPPPPTWRAPVQIRRNRGNVRRSRFGQGLM